MKRDMSIILLPVQLLPLVFLLVSIGSVSDFSEGVGFSLIFFPALAISVILSIAYVASFVRLAIKKQPTSKTNKLILATSLTTLLFVAIFLYAGEYTDTNIIETILR